MKENLQIFSNPLFGEIRIAVSENGDPLFCLADICRALGLSDTSKVKNRLSPKGVQLVDLQAQNLKGGVSISELGNTMATFITEANLYKCVLRSDKPEAESFQDWICEDVLPCIRKHGGYILEKAGDTDEDIMARALLIAQGKIKEREQRIMILEETNRLNREQIRLDQPKVQYFDDTLLSTNTYTTTQMAKELGLRSAEQLHTELKKKKVMFFQSGQWLLAAKYCGMGYTKPRTHTYLNQKTDAYETNTITVWTESGRKFLHDTLTTKSTAA